MHCEVHLCHSHVWSNYAPTKPSTRTRPKEQTSSDALQCEWYNSNNATYSKEIQHGRYNLKDATYQNLRNTRKHLKVQKGSIVKWCSID